MPTVGEILRTEREKQGLSVKDVEKATSIRALYLQAIEDGNFKVLPGEVYLKGFIRNYASFLNLDPGKMMDIYRSSQEPMSPPSPVTPAATAGTEHRREKRKTGNSTGRWALALGIIIVLAAGSWAAMNYWNQPSPTPQPPKTPPTQVQPTPPPAPLPPPPAVTQAPASSPITVTAKYTASCWTQVVADGREIYEGIPKIGENFVWNATTTMTIRFGNAAGVDLSYNGQPQGRLGGDGDVITKTFSAAKHATPAR